MKKQKPIDYIFSADCHGLQALIPYSKESAYGLPYYVRANMQRFPVWGTINLLKDVYEGMLDMMKTKEGSKLCIGLIKQTKYNLSCDMIGTMKSNWERIPNDDLDPFWHSVREK